MEFSEAFRPEDIAKSDFFDFVVTPEDNDIVLHNNFPAWSRKSMGLFTNNNNSSSAEDANGSGGVKETNNNNILPNFAVDDSFWDTGGVTKAAFAAAAAAVNIKMESPTLEDINDICWPSNCSAATPEPADAARDKDTDGSIYTLTVVSGQDAPAGGQQPGGQQPGVQQPGVQQPGVQQAGGQATTPSAPQPAGPEPPPLWYRPPDLSSILREGDEQLRQAMSAMDSQYQTSLDIDSIISILPSMDEPLHGDMTHGAMGHGLFAAGAPSEDLVEDSGFVESKEELRQDDGGRPAAYSENNNDWAYSNHNDNSAAESLLRSALQGGKSSYLSQYSGPAQPAHQDHLQDGGKTLTELGPPGSGAPPDHASLGLFMGGDGMLPMEGMLFDDSGGAGMYANGPAAAQCASAACSSTTCMDDILLSPLDDYEKLKMIENEVAESAKRYGVPHHGGHYGAAPPPSMAAPHAGSPHSSTPHSSTPHSSTPAPRPKKKSAKRSAADRPAKPKASVSSSAPSAASAASTNGGARRERSLHHCTICSKAFKDKYSVNVHIRTHTGEKPFACSVCGKSFRQKAHLAKHYHTHIVQKSEHLGPAKAMSTKAR